MPSRVVEVAVAARASCARGRSALGALNDHGHRGVRRLRGSALRARGPGSWPARRDRGRAAGRGRQGRRERQREQHQQAALHDPVASSLVPRPPRRVPQRPLPRASPAFRRRSASPLPFSALSRWPQFFSTRRYARVRPESPRRRFASAFPRSSDQERAPILGRGGRAARVPRAVPDPRGDDLPDQSLAGRDAGGRGGAGARVRPRLEHARRACVGGGLVGFAARPSATRSAG